MVELQNEIESLNLCTQKRISDIKVLMSKYEYEVLASTDLERRLNDQILLTKKRRLHLTLKSS